MCAIRWLNASIYESVSIDIVFRAHNQPASHLKGVLKGIHLHLHSTYVYKCCIAAYKHIVCVICSYSDISHGSQFACQNCVQLFHRVLPPSPLPSSLSSSPPPPFLTSLFLRVHTNFNSIASDRIYLCVSAHSNVSIHIHNNS